jgi:acyl-coenzyme A thioesterase PaaI-like protein
MRRLNNPFTAVSDYRCFGCSPDNACGLNMEFREDGAYICCDWVPRACFEGYHDVLHGGVQAALLDEIASWVVMAKLKTAGVTSRLDIRYHKPVKMSEGVVQIRAKLESLRHRVAVIKAELMGADGEPATTGMISYYLFSAEDAREKFNYPGEEKF